MREVIVPRRSVNIKFFWIAHGTLILPPRGPDIKHCVPPQVKEVRILHPVYPHCIRHDRSYYDIILFLSEIRLFKRLTRCRASVKSCAIDKVMSLTLPKVSFGTKLEVRMIYYLT